MIDNKTKIVRVSFFVPVDYEKNIYASGVRNWILDKFGAFNVYELETKETTMENTNE